MAHVDLYFSGGQSNAEAPFGSDVLAALQERTTLVGNPTVVITAHSGNSLDNWFTTTAQANYDADIYDGLGGGDLEAEIASIEAAGNTWTLRGFIWFQGEADMGDATDRDEYQTRFNAMIAQLKTDLGITYDVNVTLAVVDINQDSFYDDPANTAGVTRSEGDLLRTEQFALGEQSHVNAFDTRDYPRKDAWHITEAQTPVIAEDMIASHLAAFPVDYAELLTDGEFHDEWDCQDNGAGMSVASNSGSNNATLSGASNTSDISVSGPAGRFGRSLDLASSRKVSVPQLPQTTTADPSTVIVYFKADAIDSGFDDVFTTGDYDATLSIRDDATAPWRLFGGSATDYWDFPGLRLEANKWYKAAVRYNDGSVNLRVNRVNYEGVATGSPVLDFSGATLLGGDTREASVTVANFSFFERELTSTEVDAWLSDGTYTMADPIFDINTNDDITDTGDDGLIEGFGLFTSSGAARPVLSEDEADKVLGFRKLDFASNKSMENDADYPTYFDGDDPEWTLAAIVRLNNEALTRVILGAGNASNAAREDTGFLGTMTPWTARKDDASAVGSATASAVAGDDNYLVINRQEGTTRTIFVRKLSDGSEVSGSGTVSLGTMTATKVALGARYSNGSLSSWWRGGMYRVRLINAAVPGDVTDYNGTEFGSLVSLMLQQAGGTRQRLRIRGRRRRHYYYTL